MQCIGAVYFFQSTLYFLSSCKRSLIDCYNEWYLLYGVFQGYISCYCLDDKNIKQFKPVCAFSLSSMHKNSSSLVFNLLLKMCHRCQIVYVLCVYFFVLQSLSIRLILVEQLRLMMWNRLILKLLDISKTLFESCSLFMKVLPSPI